MKKKTLKILASTILILVMLMPYVQSIAGLMIPLKNKKLGAAGDAKTIMSDSFTGGVETTGEVPSDNFVYDTTPYFKYITSVTGINPPTGVGNNNIYIREIKVKSDIPEEQDRDFAFYCLNPTKPFPPAVDGTAYTSLGSLDEMTDAELELVLNNSLTIAELKNLLNKFYFRERVATSPMNAILETEQKEEIIKSLAIDPNDQFEIDKIYQYLTDDDIRVAQQWALWKLTSNADVGGSPFVYRTDGNTDDDLTPDGDPRPAGYQIDRNAYFFNLIENYIATPEVISGIPENNVNLILQSLKEGELQPELSHAIFFDGTNEYVDYGTFEIETTRNDLIEGIYIYDQNNNNITDIANYYKVYIGEPAAMGTSSGTEIAGTLSEILADSAKLDSLLNHKFFIRLPKEVLGIRLIVSYVSGARIITEVFEADDEQYQNVLKFSRAPNYDNKNSGLYIREDKKIDLVLRKFITQRNGETVSGREPNVTQINEAVDRVSGQTTANYAHQKQPIIVKEGDTITYTIRVYNESKQEAEIISINDILPVGLSFIDDPVLNKDWELIDTLSDGRKVIQYKPANSIILEGASKANPSDPNAIYTIDSEDITVNLLIEENASTGEQLTNIAYINEIGGYDEDSDPGRYTRDVTNFYNDIYNITNNILPGYRGDINNKEDLTDSNYHYKGIEDDDDFEKVEIVPFDLALRKFITHVNDNTVPNRAPNPNVDSLVAGTATSATYNNPKTPIQVEQGDLIKYTLRVYNEGGLAGYAKQIKDYIPSGLGFVINHVDNIEQGWVQVGSKAQLTDAQKQNMPFLSKVNLNKIAKEIPEGSGNYSATEKASSAVEIDIIRGGNLEVVTDKIANQLINAFSSGEGVTGLKYLDVEIVLIVLDELNGLNLRNWAEISNHADETTVIPKDRDSEPNNWLDHQNGPVYEDDEDYEELVTIYFDLALRKFITHVNDDKNPNTSGDAVDREPEVNVDDLIAGTATSATYSHPKTPVEVQKGDLVTYRIRVYNEGMIDGYATEIKDHIPDGLAFLPQHYKNIENGWEVVDGTGADARVSDYYPEIVFKLIEEDLEGVTDLNDTLLGVDKPVVRTEKLQNIKIDAFNPTLGVEGLLYKDVEIVLAVIDDRKYINDEYTGNLRNWAEISKHSNGTTNPVIDRDSVPDNWLVHQNGPIYEDDENFEDLTTISLRFDLALQKFVTQIISESEGRAKTPADLENKVPILHREGDNITYTTTDTEPVLVGTGDIVIYTIRVYNEGDIAGFAKKVRDTIPEGLTYLPTHSTNTKYGWYFIDADNNVVTDIEDAKFIETDYLSRQKAIEREAASQQPNIENTILDPFDKVNGTYDYKDVQIAFQVNEKATPGANNVRNIAEISDDEDADGNVVDDTDSTPGNENPNEDDIDDENLQVTYFDLSLLKIVTNVEVTENGKTRNIPTNHTFDMIPEPIVKTDLDERYLDKTQIKYTYKIRVTNEGFVDGYAVRVADYIPEGLEFHAEDQKEGIIWTKSAEGIVETTALADKLLKPGQSETVELVLRWINHRNNMGVKTNVAEIAEDNNEYDLPDIDSTPGNKKPGEDDMDDASILIAIRTGAAATFFTISLTMALIVGTGTILIKKYVV